MTPKQELNEKLLQEIFLVPIYYLDIPGSTCNIAQYTGKRVSLHNLFCYLAKTTCFLVSTSVLSKLYGNTDVITVILKHVSYCTS